MQQSVGLPAWQRPRLDAGKFGLLKLPTLNNCRSEPPRFARGSKTPLTKRPKRRSMFSPAPPTAPFEWHPAQLRSLKMGPTPSAMLSTFWKVALASAKSALLMPASLSPSSASDVAAMSSPLGGWPPHAAPEMAAKVLSTQVHSVRFMASPVGRDDRTRAIRGPNDEPSRRASSSMPSRTPSVTRVHSDNRSRVNPLGSNSVDRLRPAQDC